MKGAFLAQKKPTAESKRKCDVIKSSPVMGYPVSWWYGPNSVSLTSAHCHTFGEK